MMLAPGADLRVPERRQEVFQRFYTFHLTYRTHPGCVYHLLPAIDPGADRDQRAWIGWLNGCTQNVVTTLLLYTAAPTVSHWQNAVDYWNRNYVDLEFDTDRRHQKPRFGVATQEYAERAGIHPALHWLARGGNWRETWAYALSLPHVGRLSAWSLTEFVRILLGPAIPDADDLVLDDASGSRSHRNGLAQLAGHEAAYWTAQDTMPYLEQLRTLGADLVRDARARNPGHPDVGYLTLESTLCTYKSWHKPNRRYPNVYADMAYLRLKRAESRFGYQFDRLWQARAAALPDALRLECVPNDPGLARPKQNCYRETGQVPMMHIDWPELESDFDRSVAAGSYGVRAT